MSLPVHEFSKRLLDAGLIEDAELRRVLRAPPAREAPQTSDELAQILIRHDLLTDFQASMVENGQADQLILGEYVLLDKLGQGGMGLVYKAKHRLMDRVVAIKVLPDERTKSDDSIRRFQREVKAAARLSHPNIVAAYDAGQSSRGHFLVMEFVEGADLAEVVKREGRLSIAWAVDYVTQAARGLAYAHGKGVIHRDVKPSNLLLDGAGVVKVLDMGLARFGLSQARGQTPTESQLTEVGLVMGTPDFMAPEQAADMHEADACADIYSLGCCLYYLLTAKTPYTGSNTVQRILAHREQPIPSLRAERPEISEPLDAAYRKMLAKQPKDRYQKMPEVIAALAACPVIHGAKIRVASAGAKSPLDAIGNDGDNSPEPAPVGDSETGGATLEHKVSAHAKARLISSRSNQTTWIRRNSKAVVGTVATLCMIAVIAALSSRDGALSQNGSKAAPQARDESGWHGWPTDAPPPAIAPFDAEQAKKHQEEWARYLGVPVEYTNSIGMKFRLIPPGEFMMGSTTAEVDMALVAAKSDEFWKERIRSEIPQHKVVLTQPIYLAVHETSQAQYELICGQNPSHFAATGEGKDVVANLDTRNFPVEQVSWNDATEFCSKLSMRERLEPFYIHSGETVTLSKGTGYRLPTEAEWEFACRAGTTTRFWIGDGDEALRAAWFGGNSNDRTHAIGGLQPNPLGLFDVHGNVWEWVQDWWSPDYYGQFGENPAINPSGPTSMQSYRVFRGGDWRYQFASACRASARHGNVPMDRYFGTGFRLAMSFDAIEKLLPSQSGARVQPDHSRHVASVQNAQSEKQVTRGGWPADAPVPAMAPFNAEQAKLHQEAWAKHLSVPVEYTNSIGMKFRLIPPGEFMMGSNESPVETARFAQSIGWKEATARNFEGEHPQHRINISSAYSLGMHEVTVGQFRHFVDDRGYKTEAERDGRGGGGWNQAERKFERNPRYTWKNVGFTQEEDHPVVNVTHEDAVEFCRWLSGKENVEYRLPTEAEWEYACRAGTTARYSHGSDPMSLAWVGNVRDASAKPEWGEDQNSSIVPSSDGFVFTAPVGKYRANNFGLFDMHGNVWEWCADRHEQKHDAIGSATDANGSSFGERRVRRGGAWFDHASYARSASRYWNLAGERSSFIGFRVANNVPAPGVKQTLKPADAP